MTSPKAIGVKSAAMPAWQVLQQALLDADGPTPCAEDPDAWADPGGSLMADYAARLCVRGCPVLNECNNFATANRESAGVWGGQVRGTTKRGTETA